MHDHLTLSVLFVYPLLLGFINIANIFAAVFYLKGIPK